MLIIQIHRDVSTLFATITTMRSDSIIKSKIIDFFRMYPSHKLSKGESLLEAGENPEGVYFLTSGSIKQYAITNSGEKVIVNTFQKNAFFPMSWAINNTQNTYFFEAMEDSTLSTAPKDAVLEFIRSNPDVAYDLLARVFSGVDGVLARTAHLMGSTAYVRVLHELTIQAKRLKPETTSAVHLPIKESQLSELCGLTKETVNREFKKLKDQKLVTVSRNEIVINSLPKLENELLENS